MEWRDAFHNPRLVASNSGDAMSMRDGQNRVQVRIFSRPCASISGYPAERAAWESPKNFTFVGVMSAL